MTRSARFLFALLCLGLTTVASLTAQQSTADGDASIPHLIRFSGVLKDVDGNPAQGTVGVTFAFYKDEQGGAPLWMETQNVSLDTAGRYSVMLGSTKSVGLPAELFISKEARWLGVEPKGLPAPVRVLLLSVPYALKAVDAETIGGLPPSAFVLAAPPTGASPSNPASNPNAPPPSSAVTTSGGTVNRIPLWSTSTDIENSAITQTGSGTTAKIGIDTATPASTLDVKGGATIRGKFSLPATGAANATAGKSSQPANLAASSFNSSNSTAVTQTFQFKAEPTGNNTSTPSGTLNLLFGTGSSAPAETGLKIANNGQITFANGQTFPGTGNGSITGVTAGTALTGGGTTGNVTLNVDTSKVPLLNTANTFTGNQTVNGNLSATGVVTGSSFQIGTNLFGFGSVTQGNAFLGFGGNAVMTGTTNTAAGVYALSSNTSGSQNTAVGYYALPINSTGIANTAIGGAAMNENTTGYYNIANGSVALQQNTTGAYNTASGVYALGNNITGDLNSAIGYLAGPDSAHTALNNSTAIGAFAQVTASNALVLGSIAGVNGAGSNTNVGIGTTAPAYTLDVHGTGNFTGPITFAAGQSFPGTGTITGVTAGTALTGGGSSGNVTLSVDTTKVVTGVTAGLGLVGGGTGGNVNVAVDVSSVPLLTGGNNFTGNQTVSGSLSTTGTVSSSGYLLGVTPFAFGSVANANAFFGFSGNSWTTGTKNTAVGGNALVANTTGSGNTASGMSALSTNSTGSTNNVDGAYGLYSNTTGNFNSATGADALYTNSTGTGNTADGIATLLYNSIGNYNTAIGFESLSYNNTGSYNTALGYMAGPDSTLLSPSNATAIGAFADVTANNSMVLGSINGTNGATADTNVGIGITAPIARLHIGLANATGLRVEGPSKTGTGVAAGSFGGYGDFSIDAFGLAGGRFTVKENGRVGINTNAPDNTLSVNGTADKTGGGSWATFSDQRLKDLGGRFDSGLTQILKINPIHYRYKEENGMGIHDAEEHIGLVAQEVQKIIPEAVTENSKGYLLVNNDPIIWAMLNAIKEQQQQIQQQRNQIREQRQQMQLQQAQISRLNGKVGVLEAALRTTSEPAQGRTATRMTTLSVFDGVKKHQGQSVTTAKNVLPNE